MIEYFTIENIYKLPNWQIHSSRPPGHVNQFSLKNVSKVNVTRAHNVYS